MSVEAIKAYFHVKSNITLEKLDSEIYIFVDSVKKQISTDRIYFLDSFDVLQELFIKNNSQEKISIALNYLYINIIKPHKLLCY
jgi:hypothetical protein